MARPTQRFPHPSATSGVAPERALFKGELIVIRKAAHWFALAVGVSLLLAGGSELLRWKLFQDRQQARDLHASAQGGLAQTLSEKEEIRDFQPKFEQLRERGFVGDERRLDWIETINRSQRAHRLLPVKYKLAAQRVFDSDPALVTGAMQLHGSTMTLDLKLWHEGDLLRLMDDLKDRGLFVPLECELIRTGSTQDNPSPAGLDAQCRLVWLTLRAPDPESANGYPGR